MPEFPPSESKIAIAPITAEPAGMDCEAELFLGPDELTKVATSGRVPFVSTGAVKNVSLPITMPATPATYHGYIDVFTNGLRFLAYKTVEDVVIVPVGVAEFVYVSDIRVTPLYVYPPSWEHSNSVMVEVDVKNIGNAVGICSIQMYYQYYFKYDSGRDGWYGWYPLSIDPRHRPQNRFWEAEIAPGETITLYGEGEVARGYWIREYKFKVTGSPGEIETLWHKAWTD